MRIHLYIARLLIGFIIATAQTDSGSASEIKVLSTHAVLEVLSELGPQFETVPRLVCIAEVMNATNRRVMYG